MTEKHFCLDDSPEFRMLELGEVTSTNDFLRGYKSVDGERRITLVTTEYQTAGRGSGTNHWQSERGENLLFSLLVHPRHVSPSNLFVLSEVLALSVLQALSSHLSLLTSHLKIKWPNDIYYGDRKICGMLIENNLKGNCVEDCVMGVGININQTTFGDELPNPISLVQILGHPVERRFVLERVMEFFTRYFTWTELGRDKEIHEMYLNHLYRRNEKCHFSDEKGDFYATIIDVKPTGHLVVVDETGKERRYGFKEIQFLI